MRGARARHVSQERQASLLESETRARRRKFARERVSSRHVPLEAPYEICYAAGLIGCGSFWRRGRRGIRPRVVDPVEELSPTCTDKGDNATFGKETILKSLGWPEEPVARLTARPVGTPLSKVRVRASHGQPARRPEPVYRPFTRGPTLIDGRPQRVGVGLGSRALLGAVAVSTAGLAGRTEGPTLVATLRPHRPWIGGAGRYGGHQARVRSHRPWSGAVRGAWPQAVTRAGADEGSEAEGSRSHLRTEV